MYVWLWTKNTRDKKLNVGQFKIREKNIGVSNKTCSSFESEWNVTKKIYTDNSAANSNKNKHKIQYELLSSSNPLRYVDHVNRMSRLQFGIWHF